MTKKELNKLMEQQKAAVETIKAAQDVAEALERAAAAISRLQELKDSLEKI